jgi:hypothetical protein
MIPRLINTGLCYTSYKRRKRIRYLVASLRRVRISPVGLLVAVWLVHPVGVLHRTTQILLA